MSFEGSDAIAMINYNKIETPGSLHGVKLHTSQLSTRPEMFIDYMIGQNVFTEREIS